MKTFVYCEVTECGMEHHICSFEEEEKINFPIYKWKSELSWEKDYQLVDWCHQAEIGDYTKHRLGIVFRVNDEK